MIHLPYSDFSSFTCGICVCVYLVIQLIICVDSYEDRHSQHIEECRHYKNPSCSPFIGTLTSLSPEFCNPSQPLISISVVLLVQESYINGIIWYGTFLEFFFLLSIFSGDPFKLLCISVVTHFLLPSSIPWHHDLFDCSPIEGHLGCFQFPN